MLVFLGIIAGVLCFIRSTVTFPIIRTEEQAERNIRTLYFYDEKKYKDSELEVISFYENEDFVLYAFTIDDEPDITYDVYDNQGNLIIENEEL